MFMYIVAFVVVICVNKCASIYAKARAESLLEKPYVALPDIIHSISPRINCHIPDYVLLTLLVYCVVYGKFNGVDLNLVNALLDSLFLRPIFVVGTTLPTCMLKPNKKETYYTKLFLSTHDLMFSGHTCIFMFFGKIIGGNIGIVVQYMMPVLLVMARQHYTIDILVSMIVYNYFCV